MFHYQRKDCLVRNYYSSGNNASEAARKAGENPPHASTVMRLICKFEESESVADGTWSGRPSVSKSKDFQRVVLQEIDSNTPTSTCRIAHQISVASDYDVSHVTVFNTLKELSCKPYIPCLFHALNEDDPDMQKQSCEIFEEMFRADPSWINNIIWSDEAIFKLNGHLNCHNCVYWNATNLHYMIEKNVNLPGLTVWCGISSVGIIGPYFFDGCVTGKSYLEMLQHFLIPRLVHYDDDIMFQQDGAPPHFASVFRDFLDKKFPGRWIGRRGPIKWPARLPDLTPADFFLWGVLKDKVYSHNPITLDQLRSLISQQLQTIDIRLCRKVCRSVQDRMAKCIQNEGWHFEHLL